jgi:hypothetical protein
MQWLLDVLGWLILAYIVCGAVAMALLLVLWVFTVVVVVVASILQGEPTAPDWLDALWDEVFGGWTD